MKASDKLKQKPNKSQLKRGKDYQVEDMASYGRYTTLEWVRGTEDYDSVILIYNEFDSIKELTTVSKHFNLRVDLSSINPSLN